MEYYQPYQHFQNLFSYHCPFLIKNLKTKGIDRKDVNLNELLNYLLVLSNSETNVCVKRLRDRKEKKEECNQSSTDSMCWYDYGR
jgi:hypothetical protein